MSTVFDVTSITIDDGAPLGLSAGVDNVSISVVNVVETVTVSTPDPVDSAMVEVPGMQGAPGVKNVYVQLANPAVANGWGMAEKGYIWIEVDV